MPSNAEIVAGTQQHIIENYGRLPVAMVRGEGPRIWDADGNEFLDFFAGFGGAGVAGHSHPAIVQAVTDQMARLQCHGNLFTNAAQLDLAERITRHGFGGKCFFCHSGAEANEAALKLVRLEAGEGKYKIISFHGCFHGRTMGGLSLTPESFQKGFEPMLPGNVKVDFGDLQAVEQAIDHETAGVFVEPIQGEGGMNVPSAEFMQGLRKLCDERGILLVCDEVWTSPARTGEWFAHQLYDISPDVMTLAKAVGGGLPVGVCVAAPKYADVLVPGTHGCTMGGMPVCASAGAAAMKLIEDENLTERAKTLGEKITSAIESAGLGHVTEIRGAGLMVGIQLDDAIVAKDVMMACMSRGLLICIAKNNVIRLAPPLITPEVDIDRALEILIPALRG